MPDDPADETPQTRPLSRRRLMRVGTPIVVGTLAGCSAWGDDQTDSPPATQSGTATGTGETAETATETTPAPLEPLGTKQPLAEKYQGLRVLDRWRAGEASSRDVYTHFTTPLESFYVVSHFETPVIDADEHEVTVVGNDGASVEVDVDSLRSEYPTESVVHTMQCAGNGRKYFQEMDGWQFGYGAVGTAEWTGTPVSAVFDAHDVAIPPDAWVTAAGADGPANDADRVFARSIPASKLLDDCLIVYRMNDHALPLEHGFPVRLIVPGWYGTNSIKWLSELRVMDGMVRDGRWRAYSEWQQHHYRIIPQGAEESVHATIDTLDTWDQIEASAAGTADHYPYVYDMTVKSLIGYPGDGATVSPRDADGTIEVFGVAWAGDDAVERVEVSTDGGESWNRARFLGPDRGPGAWRQFRYQWDVDPGEYTLYSRATDDSGRTQPRDIGDPDAGLDVVKQNEYPWNRGGYASNAFRDLGVTVDVET